MWHREKEHKMARRVYTIIQKYFLRKKRTNYLKFKTNEMPLYLFIQLLFTKMLLLRHASMLPPLFNNTSLFLFLSPSHT